MITTLTHRLTLVALATTLLVVGVGCESETSDSAEQSNKEEQVESQQETGGEAAAEAAETESEDGEAQKIVTLGGTVTEVVYALGAGDRVVAVDKTSVYPPETEDKRTLDLFSKTSAESVLSYEPDIVIATEEVEPPEALEKIEAADVKVVEVEPTETIEGALERIATIGEALGLAEKAEELNEKLEKDVIRAREVADTCEEPPKTLFVYARGKGTVFVSGTDTSAAKMIEKAGGEHVPKDIEGFKPLTPESVVDVSPDAIVLTTRGLQSLGGVEGLAKLPGLGESKAVENGRVVAMDDLKLLGFGPRSGQALEELSRKLCQLDEDG